MSQEYEKVDKFEFLENYKDTKIFDIDLTNKCVPEVEGQTLIAGESNSQLICFKVPRYYDGIDLSTKKIKFLYISPNSFRGFNEAVNVFKNDEFVKFSWLIPKIALASSGELVFAVEFKNWHDEDYTLKTQQQIMNVINSIDDLIEEEPQGQTWYDELRSDCNEALTEVRAALNTIPIPQYGVEYDSVSKNPTLERVGAAVGLVASTGVGADKNVVNDFDNIYPWSEMKRCTMTPEGIITAFKGEVKYAEDGSLGNVMVKIPKFYIKRVVDKNSGFIYRYVCKEKLNGYHTPAAFIKNGKEVDEIYVAAYHSSILNGQFASVVGVNCWDGIPYGDYVSTSNNSKIGYNWHALDLATMEVLQTLFIVEFATLNSKRVFSGCLDFDWNSKSFEPDSECISDSIDTVTVTGSFNEKTFYIGQCLNFYNRGLKNVTTEDSNLRTIKYLSIEKVEEEKIKVTITLDTPVRIDENTVFSEWLITGQCNNVEASSGICGEGLEEHIPFVWRGIENLYGFDYFLVDGIKIISDGYYVTDDINAYGTEGNPDSDENYHLLSYHYPSATGYISELGFDENYPYALLPVKATGTADTGYCDEFYRARRMTTGICYVVSFYDGLFHCDISSKIADYDSFASRLVYHKG